MISDAEADRLVKERRLTARTDPLERIRQNLEATKDRLLIITRPGLKQNKLS